jgi:hypothetical protein
MTARRLAKGSILRSWALALAAVALYARASDVHEGGGACGVRKLLAHDDADGSVLYDGEWVRSGTGLTCAAYASSQIVPTHQPVVPQGKPPCACNLLGRSAWTGLELTMSLATSHSAFVDPAQSVRTSF